MAQNNLSILQTIPLFYGNVNGRPVHGETAERFMRSIRHTIGTMIPEPTNKVKIGMVVRHLRDLAHDWWFHRCLTPPGAPCAYDRHRIETDFDYFCQQFEAKFFASRDQLSISTDLSDVKPRDGELASQYLDRLMYAARPVSALSRERAVQQV